MASPKDRLAAAVLDIVLLLPLIRLIQAPLKREITETFFLEGDFPWFYGQFSFGILLLFCFVSQSNDLLERANHW